MMSSIEIDEDLIQILNQMKRENETINDVLRKVLSSMDTDKTKLRYVSKEEFDTKSDEILKKYHNLLVKLAE